MNNLEQKWKKIKQPNPRLQPTPASQPKLLKEQRRAVLLRGGRLWPRLKDRTLNYSFRFPVKMVIRIRNRPSGPHSRILRIGSPRYATMLDPKEHGIKHASRGRAHRCSSLGGRAEPPPLGAFRKVEYIF
jgi:hypothetical protein